MSAYWLTDEVETVLLQPNFNEDLFYQSAITGSFFPAMGPRLTLRRRPLGTLPTVEDSAEDLDNLDDVSLVFIPNHCIQIQKQFLNYDNVIGSYSAILATQVLNAN